MREKKDAHLAVADVELVDERSGAIAREGQGGGRRDQQVQNVLQVIRNQIRVIILTQMTINLHTRFTEHSLYSQ